MSDLSLLDGVLTLNGHEFTGFGDSETALDFPNVDIATMRRGADGKSVTGKTGNFGGPLNLLLLQNSPSFKFLMGIQQAMKNGGAVEFNGIYRHEIGGFSLSLSAGGLINAPMGPTLGVGAPTAKSFIIEFGRIDSDYSTANV